MKSLLIVVGYEDIKTKNSFDKDIFRENKGDLIKSYSEILNRLKIEAGNV